MHKALPGLRSLLVHLWLPVALIALWWVASASSTSPFFPPLSEIVGRLQELWFFEHTRSDLLPSLRNLALGYAAAAVIGISAGALLWRVRPIATAAHPVIYFLYVLPAPALLPAVILIFGIGVEMKVWIIFFTCVWPVLLNTLDGMRGTDKVKLDVASALRLNTWDTMRRVVLPAASPQIFAGLRTALAFGIILMVVSEMAAATQGIGYFILYAQQTFETLDMWTGILVLGIAGSILNFLFLRIERRLLRWHYQARQALQVP
ncbi:ABC transporter permease [Modestobacter lapidis]|nr:ABC transporter permease [Modestobacter lapidis]